MQAYSGYVPDQNGRPTRLPARFEWFARKINLPGEPVKTKKEVFIKKYHAGNPPDTTFRPATEQDKLDYPEQWEAFQRGEDQASVGWPIDKAPFLDDAQAAAYREIGIKSLEGLAEAHDATVDKIMGGKEHRKKAQALLKDSIDKKPLMDALTKVEEQGKELAELKAQISQLAQSQAQAAEQVVAPQAVAAAVAIKPGRKKASELSGLAPAVLPESDD